MEVGNLTHSHSQPGEIDRTPPGTPKKGGKMLAVRVQMLDDTVTMFQIQAKALGRVLFDQVCNQLNLLESDYFGLEYQEGGGTKYWLDLEKPVCRQIGLSLVDILVRFCVKFYTPDPSQLEEEFTRYLFCLQIKRDLSQGLLQCNSNTAALMASYIVQAECGDYVVEDYPDHRYLSSYKFVPNQDQELERRIMENHKKHAGQSPAEADLNLLETARRCELYGIKMHPAKDHEGCPLNLAVAHMGIVVFQNFSKINTFSWAKIRKISFKRKKFLVKLHPEGYGYYKDTVEFFFEGRNECKNFWKKCVENHGFFRCIMVKKVPRQKTRVLSRGSSFRYSGRTQKQIVDFVRENYVKRQTFQRSQSFRHSSSAHSSVANVGTSISAHPLLPLGDNAVAGTPVSLSCGSMTLTSSPVHTADIHVGGSPSPPLTTSVSPGTSVTSSPQHIYPQETPYHRTGHRPTKVKRSPVRSHHAISPLSPTDAATTAANRSANRSNNITPDVSDIVTSPDGFKRPDFIRFNHIYSNCYTSFRSLANHPQNDVSVLDGTKIDIFGLPSHLFNGTSNTNEAIGSPEKSAKTLLPANEHDFDRCTWHRSASCKDLYRDADAINQKTQIPASELPDKTATASPVTCRDKCRRKCYSAVVSKNPSIERTGDGSSDMRVYSSSYPGTTSSLSTESAEGELEDRIAEVLDVRYDSQEDIGLSHDDVSHDSYELLERELEERHDDSLKSTRDLILVGENERARSCSWGSDRGVSLLDFHSTESGLVSGLVISREQNFGSLERGKSSKHKSESDFRTLGSKCSMDCRSAAAQRSEGAWEYNDGVEGMGKMGEFLDYDNRLGKSTEIKEEIPKKMSWKKQLENRTVSGKESCRSIGEEIELRESPKGWEESFKEFERHIYEKRRKSIEEPGLREDCYVNPMELNRDIPVRLEEVRRVEKRREKKEREERFHEGLKEQEEKEWEKRQGSRRKSVEELRGEEVSRKMLSNSGGYGNFQEIQFKKFDRVVSNQFGRYSEFLTQENSFFAQEKVMENYDKVCQTNRMVKELKNSPSGNVLAEKCVENIERVKAKDAGSFGESMEFEEWKNGVKEPGRLADNSGGGSRTGRTVIERTKSDPYNSVKNQKRNILSHQKSVDLTPQQSEETISDYDNEDGFKKGSRSEHDIPYVLHKRHCMNGTARNADLKMSVGYRSSNHPDGRLKNNKVVIEAKKSNAEVVASLKQRPSSAKMAEAKKAGVQIINLDAKNGKAIVNIPESKKGSSKSLKAPSAKKTTAEDNETITPKATARKDLRKPELLSKVKKDMVNTEKTARIPDEPFAKHNQNDEPIYAEVCKEKPVPEDEFLPPPMVPPQPPKRSSSCSQKPDAEGQRNSLAWERGEPPQKRTGTGEQESVWEPLEEEGERRNEWKGAERKGRGESVWGWGRGRGKGAEVHGRREESQTLFARTRLGVSEGSAFAAILREGVKGSPGYQRRTKSLDAPYVSVHSLPPADAFSSKDDTVEGSEEDLVNSAVSRFRDFCRGEGKGNGNGKTGESGLGLDVSGNTESEVDSVFTDDLEMDSAFKKSVEKQSKVEINFGDEKVLDAVRGKRLLSKIESVDFIDSEGDMDSSRLAEPHSIPSDRVVNLPECIRFPSVRQISGQTSEESADGWDQEKVKVKRRTPRRSVGREEQGVCRESVVWDSKDEEPPDDVWDEKVGAGGKYEGLVVNIGLGGEYLKRGSCGQSIDDDNLSTPMKESSPEHWVSVDDLPEALEREEKLLKQQEKILREKILNEKLKRELNLDTIDVDERYCDYKGNVKQSKYEDETMSLKESLKGHSLDTYELIEKKGRERRPNKMCTSLDEDLLSNKLCHAPLGLEVTERPSADEPAYAEGLDYLQCKVVKDMAEIEQFGDNDEELEEFFVVLDEGSGREDRNMVWEDEDSLRRTLSNDESLISVPEEFKDVEGDAEERPFKGKVEILLSEVGGQGEQNSRDLALFASHEELGCEVALMGEEKKLLLEEGGGSKEWVGDMGGLSPLSGSRRGSEEKRKPSLSEETGRLSPYDSCSRRGSDEPRRPSTSEDSRKCSVSESVSEETRRRLSSTEETRRKRASLTKQCSVGADSLSDEVISGIQECSSSFEHDERDVFEAESMNSRRDNEEVDVSVCLMNLVAERGKDLPPERLEALQPKDSKGKKGSGVSLDTWEGVAETTRIIYLAPPSSEHELSRETEDSIDYGEGDLKDITDTVKEKDMSDEAVPYMHSLQQSTDKLQSSVEKSEFSENDDFSYIDEKRGGTPEIIVGKSKEDVAMSIVVVNEGISILKKINEKDKGSERDVEAQPLLRVPVFGVAHHQQRHTLPKTFSKPKSHTPKFFEYIHRKMIKNYASEIKVKTPNPVGKESTKLAKTSLDSSQESDLDKLSDISLVSHVQREISRRNLSDVGKWLRRYDIGTVTSGDSGSWKTSEEKEKTDQRSGDDLATGEERQQKEGKLEKAGCLQLGFEGSKGKREGGNIMGREKKSPDQEKRDSGEDGSSSSSAPLYPKRELSSTWKPFLLESSGSSSLEEGWLPPDESAHLADEEETSSTSNNQQDDSYHDDIDFPTGIGYPVLNVSNAEMMIGAYGNVYALSRTLSRISERSMSEQERSDLEDDITKPTSHSISIEEESILSSDHQPSLSSDPPSPKEIASTIPDLPVDRPISHSLPSSEISPPLCEPFDDVIPPPVPEEDWPSPPSSPSFMDTPVVSHIETFYMEIHPEKACKVVVEESREGENSSSDDNQTLHEESEFLVLSGDNMSASTTTTTTTQDGTVVIPMRSRSGKRGSVSEEASMMSNSERSGITCMNEEAPERGKGTLSRNADEDQSEISRLSASPGKYCPEQDSQKSKISGRIKPLKLSSPTGKTFGFFETPVSKVRSPTSQMKFFETADRGTSGCSNLLSPTSFSETTSPKNYGRFFDGSVTQTLMKSEVSERCSPRNPKSAKGYAQRSACTPYYSNVADSAEKSYFDRYDTGSLERTKIRSSRKCSSYYSVSRTAPIDGDGSNSDGPPAPSPNTIPRASKRTKKRHRVDMDLIVRDGRIVAPPKTNTTVLENSDSDRSL